MLLIHLGCGHSVHETAVRTRQVHVTELSAVALWNWMTKSQAGLRARCVDLFVGAGLQVRAADATTVREPGKTASLERAHHNVHCNHWPTPCSS